MKNRSRKGIKEYRLYKLIRPLLTISKDLSKVFVYLLIDLIPTYILNLTFEGFFLPSYDGGGVVILSTLFLLVQTIEEKNFLDFFAW